jgi:hypothetical protein
MDLFWSKVMPASIVNYSWSKDFSAGMSIKKWQEGIKAKIVAMDPDEFDLFLAGVVMAASRAQMMGVTLTEKIEYFRSLRA